MASTDTVVELHFINLKLISFPVNDDIRIFTICNNQLSNPYDIQSMHNMPGFRIMVIRP